MSVREQMIRVLRSSDAQRIRFSFTGSSGISISIDGSTFQRVAQALAENRIHIVEGGRVPRGWALYSARDNPNTRIGNLAANTFYVGSGEHWSRAFDALLIHESVHASFDLTMASLPWLDNEAAAYIAQGYYLRNTGFGIDRLDHVGQNNQPYLGRRIAESIISNGTADSFWLDQLHNSLRSSPQYSSYIQGTFTGDG